MKPSTTQAPSISPVYTKIAKAILQNLRRLCQPKQLYDRALANYDSNPYQSIQMIRQTPAGKEHFDEHMLQFASWNESFGKAVEKAGKKNQLKNFDICQRLISLQPKLKLTNLHGNYLTYVLISMKQDKNLALEAEFFNVWKDIKIELRKSKEQASKNFIEQQKKPLVEQKQPARVPVQPSVQQPPPAVKIQAQTQKEKQRKLQQQRRLQKQKQQQLKKQQQQKLDEQKRQQEKVEQQRRQNREKQQQRRRDQQERQRQRKKAEQLRKQKQLERQKEQQRIQEQQRKQKEEQQRQQRQQQRKQAERLQQQKKLQQKINRTKLNEARWKKNKEQRLVNIIKYLESRKDFSYGNNQTGVAKEIFHNLERFMKDKMEKILKFSKIRTPGIASEEMGDQFRLYSNKSNIFSTKQSIMLPETELKIIKLKYPSKSQLYVRLRIEQQKLEQKLKGELRQKTEGDKKLQKIIQSYIITDQNVQHEFERDQGPPKRKRLTVLSQVIQYVIELDPWFKDLYIMEKTFYKGFLGN